MQQTGIFLPFMVGVSPTLGIRGLIATTSIKEGELVERCPAIVYASNEKLIDQTIFSYYVFEWDATHEALALGYGSLYNHSYKPNITVDFDIDKQEILFIAKQTISVGEELFINYNDDSIEPIDAGYLDFDQRLKN